MIWNTIRRVAVPVSCSRLAPDLPVQAGAVARTARATEHPEYLAVNRVAATKLPARNAYDSLELKDIAARIKSKFEEFNVHGTVVQINPGPVVTTFEFKPEAGIKYSRITTLTEDLCLGLQAESILIERIPGKPTVGIEVPNSRREVISLRQILESEEFQQFAFEDDDLPGQGYQRPHQGGRARIDAAPADRGIHRIGQERDAQLDDHVDSLQGHAG